MALWTLDYGDILALDPSVMKHIPHGTDADIRKVIASQKEVLQRLFLTRGIDLDNDLDETAAPLLETIHLYQVMAWLYRYARREEKDRYDLLAKDYENKVNSMIDQLPLPAKAAEGESDAGTVRGAIRVFR